MVEEQIPPRTAGGKGNHRRPAAAPQRAVSLRAGRPVAQGQLPRPAARRGRYRFGPLRLSTRFPFGLFSRTITVGRVGDADRVAAAGPADRRLGRAAAGGLAGADRRRRRPGTEGDFYGVREWRSGDGRRLIHWRSSARLGKLVVRQFERPRSRDVAVVLDLWQPPSPTARTLENVELAVSFAATVLADLCRKGGSNVYLGLSDSAPECVGGPASPATLQGLMERLAIVEAARRRRPAGAACPRPAADRRRHGDRAGQHRPVDLADTSRFAPCGPIPCCASGCAVSAASIPRASNWRSIFKRNEERGRMKDEG